MQFRGTWVITVVEAMRGLLLVMAVSSLEISAEGAGAAVVGLGLAEKESWRRRFSKQANEESDDEDALFPPGPVCFLVLLRCLG